MKTLDEWFPSGRGDGRKFRRAGWPDYMWFEPLVKACDCSHPSKAWHGLLQSGSLASYDEEDCVNTDFFAWQPQTKKKVTMYRPIIQSSTGSYFSYAWDSNKAQFNSLENIVGWQECEVEVDE